MGALVSLFAFMMERLSGKKASSNENRKAAWNGSLKNVSTDTATSSERAHVNESI